MKSKQNAPVEKKKRFFDGEGRLATNLSRLRKGKPLREEFLGEME